MPRTTSAAVVMAVGLLLAGCTAGADEPGPAPDPTATTEPDPDGVEEEHEKDRGRPHGPAPLSPWVHTEAGQYFITAAPGRVLLSHGDQDLGGPVFTRDVAAYDAEGSMVWQHRQVRERHNLPEAAPAGEHVVLIDMAGNVPTLRALDWDDGAEAWSQRVDEVVPCIDEVSVRPATQASVLLEALGQPCTGESPRPVASSIDAVTGQVHGVVEAHGAVTGATSPDGTQGWYLQVHEGGAQLHRIESDTGEVETDLIDFAPDTLELLVDPEVQMHTMWAVSDHEVALMAWVDMTEVSVVLADLESGQARVFEEAAVCGDALAIVDAPTRTCLVYDQDLQVGTVYDFDGNDLWHTEGSAGLTMDGNTSVAPVQLAERRVWLISAGDDIIQARDVRTGAELWSAGAGEGSGVPSSHHPTGSQEVVVGIQHGSPATQVLRLDASTGVERDRQDLTDAWVYGNDYAVAVHAEEATLLAFVEVR